MARETITPQEPAADGSGSGYVWIVVGTVGGPQGNIAIDDITLMFGDCSGVSDDITLRQVVCKSRTYFLNGFVIKTTQPTYEISLSYRF